MDKNCALCCVKITTENDSKEHVIPNAIGGRRKVMGFICNQCNNQTGDAWDSELAKQLNPLSLLFRISRERGSPPPQEFITTSGASYVLDHKGAIIIPKPIFSKIESENGVSIDFTVRVEKELRQMLKGLKKKYPQIDEAEFLMKAKVKSRYLDDPMHFKLSIGGPGAGRSLVKSALAMVVDHGIPPEKCELAIKYLRGDDASVCFGYFHEEDLVLGRPEGIPIHCVHVKGLPETKQVLGYVEFFGIYRMIICLSETYDGEEFSSTYSINPMNSEEIRLDVKLEFSSEEIQEIYDYKKVARDKAVESVKKVMLTAMELSEDRERKRVVSSAVHHSFDNVGLKDGEQITQEHIVVKH